MTSRHNCYATAWTDSIDNGTKDPTPFMGSPVGNVRYGAMHQTRGGSLYEGVANKEKGLRLFAIPQC